MTATPQLLSIEAVARQPLFLGTGPQAGNRRTTASIITGATLRGALASMWIADHGEPDDVFHELFDGAISWPSLLPDDHTLVPLTVRRCKYRRLSDCERTALDSFTGGSATGDLADPHARCPSCHGPLELAKGEVVALSRRHRVSTISRTAAALDIDETPKDGELFTRDGVPAGTRLGGAAPLLSSLSDVARRWVNGLEGRRLRVGGRRSVAGSVEILTVGWMPVTAMAGSPRGALLAIRLQTPAVILDTFGAASVDPASALRGTVLEARARVMPESCAIRPVLVGGWNALAGLPRPDETAMAAGSTLVVEVTSPSGITDADWEHFITGGLGARRSEGFGLVSVDTNAWSFPATVIDGMPTLQPAVEIDRSHGLLELVGVLDGRSDDRAATAAWFVGRFSSFAMALRATPDQRDTLVTTSMRERRLRDYDAPIVDAYRAVLADDTLAPDDLDAIARLMSLHEHAESLQERS